MSKSVKPQARSRAKTDGVMMVLLERGLRFQSLMIAVGQARLNQAEQAGLAADSREWTQISKKVATRGTLDGIGGQGCQACGLSGP